MNYADGISRLNDYRMQIYHLREKLREVQAEIEPQPVDDYRLSGPDGEVRLSALFGGHDELFVVHNMGTGCAYCTLWADGFNGIYPQLARRAAFVVSSPDSPDVQARFAEARGWRFPMVSHQGTGFAADMGYRSDDGFLPGLSVFQRRDGGVVRISEANLGPGDDFCIVWHMFDLLPDGAGAWQPSSKPAAA